MKRKKRRKGICGKQPERDFCFPQTVESQEKDYPPGTDEPTWRCQDNPLVGALGIQEPVILGEPQVKG